MSRYGKNHAPGCKCTDDFTCKECLEVTVDRNAADRNANPLAFYSTPKKSKPKADREAKMSSNVKTAQTWVDQNCRFATAEWVRDSVRTASLGKGIKLSSHDVDCCAVKMIVYAGLMDWIGGKQNLTPEAVLDQYYGINKSAFDDIIADAVAGSPNIENAVNSVIGLLQQKASKATESGQPLPTMNWNSPGVRAMVQGKVREYLKSTDPATLYVQRGQKQGLEAGPYTQERRQPQEQPRARVGRPPATIPNTQAPRLRPRPEERPIPRTPYPNPLPA